MRQSIDNLKNRERLKSFHKKLAPPYGVAIMGILNVTPDSFFDGGVNFSVENAIAAGHNMITEGADILDIGGQSSRPGAENISAVKEWARVEPVLKGILDHFPDAKISIDTYRAEVARKAIEEGAVLVNDISAGSLDPEILDVVASTQAPYVLMHMAGKPENMQNSPSYESVVDEVYAWFEIKLQELSDMGIKEVIIDPGFGFGKRLEDNYKLLKNLERFKEFGNPILVGASRKSMIYKALDCEPNQALNGTTAIHAWALERGASLLRCHDVKAAREVVALHHHICSTESQNKPI
ncbi:MAG TPA: dihydropteroate synthase [Flavobacteriales bacterium]|jgi:dihydropteroate synthase|nr:dihydropteroate synthase [Flavobacteriales bacterium]HIB76357.1 dihydropteroate synthase [Flavobacteriales bacterium]HIN42078.1 dihydropteroate synthase [Flavobacteriales bacterium]HIO16768.1 dihydropteroate synthase [Flavobacteriales bacterium]HIO59998.1 dihydropteroate synthase [Flavobacteriales bacterium]